MNVFLFEIVVIALLCIFNGILSMAELAMVSVNRGRLAALRQAGDRRAAVALELADNSAEFLATVQIGITLVGIVAGVYGGATLAEDLGLLLTGLGIPAAVAASVSFIIIIGGITFVSLVLGELVPKQIALSHPEQVALLCALPLRALSKLCRPLVALLEGASSVVTRIFPFAVGDRSEVREEDIHHLISEGAKSGEILDVEKDMAFRVFRLDDRPISAFMTPRRDVVWLDIEEKFEDLWQLALRVSHTYFPVAEGALDKTIGVVSMKDLCLVNGSQGQRDLRSVLRPVVSVASSRNALAVLEQFKRERRQLAIVLDEHGTVDGVVTTHDLLEAIVGDLADYDGEGQTFVQRQDGSWLVDATADIQELLLKFPELSRGDPASDEYHSVGGLVFGEFGRVPQTGEKIEWNGLLFEVVDMDGHRIDKVLVSEMPQTQSDPEEY